MPLDKIHDMLGQVDEKTTLSYIYNPNTEQENLDIMNKALNSRHKKSKKNWCKYDAHIDATKNPFKIKGLRKRETAHEVHWTSDLRGPKRSGDIRTSSPGLDSNKVKRIS